MNGREHRTTWNDRIRQAGFFSSLLGICGVVLVGPFGVVTTHVGFGLAFFSLAGIALSGVALLQTPCRLAIWGLVIGCVGALYFPTFCLTLF